MFRYDLVAEMQPGAKRHVARVNSLRKLVPEGEQFEIAAQNYCTASSGESIHDS